MLERVWRKGNPLTQLLWKTVRRVLKKLKIELPYDPATPLLDIHLQKTMIWKDTCTPTFTAALFTVAKTWKKPKCSLLDGWVKKMSYIYTVEHYSATEKEQNNAICSNMDGPIYYHTKWSQSEENTWYHFRIYITSGHISESLLYMRIIQHYK